MRLMFDEIMRNPTEFVLLESKIIQEAPDKPKTFKLIGPNMVAETKNVNGRIYPIKVCESAADNYIKTWINTNRAYGEFEHPDRSYVDANLAADRMTKLERDPSSENIWIGESVVMCSDPSRNIHGTPKGDILAGILQYGGQVGRSSRGVGDFDKSTGLVNEGYQIVAFDTVIDPSGPGCFAESIVEGVLTTKEFMINEHGVIVEMVYTNLDKKLAHLPRHDKERYVTEAIRSFLNSI